MGDLSPLDMNLLLLVYSLLGPSIIIIFEHCTLMPIRVLAQMSLDYIYVMFLTFLLAELHSGEVLVPCSLDRRIRSRQGKANLPGCKTCLGRRRSLGAVKWCFQGKFGV